MTDLLTHDALPAVQEDAPADVHTDADVPACALAGTVSHALTLAVAPSTGRFRPAVGIGDEVQRGAIVGHVTGGGGRADAVYAPVSAVVEAHLTRAGQLVKSGRGLVWLSQRGVKDAATAGTGQLR